MPTQTLRQPRFTPFRTLCALWVGAAIVVSAHAFADELSDAQRLIRSAQYPQALEKVDAFLGGNPKDAQGRFLKALIFSETGKPNEAIVLFTQLTEDYPELPEPYNNLAVLYAQQKQYEKARLALEMAIRAHPSYSTAYENLGDLYAKLASQAYDKALQLNANNTALQKKLVQSRDLVAPPTKVNAKPADSNTTPPATPDKTTEPAAAVTDTPRSAPAIPAPPDTEIGAAIAAWADAWSRKDMPTYLASYAQDFRAPSRLTRKDWEASRTQKIAGKQAPIRIEILDPTITVDGDKATASFRQRYTSTGYSTVTRKTLSLVRADSRWLIQSEISR